MIPGIGEPDPSPPPLSHREFNHDSVDFEIRYTTNAGSDQVADADIDDVEDQATDSYDGYQAAGFRAPYQVNLPDYLIKVRTDTAPHAEPDCIVLLSSDVSGGISEGQGRARHVHEMFHNVQRAYMCDLAGIDCTTDYVGSSLGKWVAEGSNDAVRDRIHPAIDDVAGSYYYEDRASSYLSETHQSLFDTGGSHEYHVCLFWSYLAEQLGSDHSEPAYGLDFIRRFYDQLATDGPDGVDSLGSLRRTIARYTQRSLEELFIDFASCNYAREFDATGLDHGDRYRYVDEAGQPLTDDVVRTRSFGSFPQSEDNRALEDFSARYYEVSFDPQNCGAVGFRVQADDEVGFALVGVAPDGTVQSIASGRGTDLGRTIVNTPEHRVNRICGIVVGLSDDTLFDYDFAQGPVTVSIVRPNSSFRVFPGPHDDPDQILVRVMVDGPAALKPAGIGNRSVLGLTAADFDLRIGSEDVTDIISAAYVGGEYWLVVQAPVQAVDDIYDLSVSLCDKTVSTVAPDAVEYGPVEMHHVVTLDVSGSMDDDKLGAAKEAAKFLIDAVRETDQFTVVSFSGDDVECNEDATNIIPGGGLMPGLPANREDAKQAVDDFVREWRTSIGDGLWTSQDALDAAAAAPGLVASQTIYLLSDGRQNEARYWATDECIGGGVTVRDRIVDAGTMINAYAFGADADEPLLLDMSTGSTGGDYSYIEVAGAAAAPAAPRAGGGGPAAMQNRLTEAFIGGLEHSSGLQRLAYATQTVAGGATATIELRLLEGPAHDALLYAGWAVPKAGELLEIRDPDNNVIGPGDARIFGAASHRIHHLNAAAKAGNYQFRVRNKGAEALEFFAGLSGRPAERLKMRLAFGQVRGGGPKGEPESPYERFEQGLPVDIMVMITDIKGAVRTADVSVRIILPGGREFCGSPAAMLDDGARGDSAAGDGVFTYRFRQTFLASAGGADNDEGAGGAAPGGSYQVIVGARGKTNLGSGFERVLDGGFQVFDRGQGGDLDNDGIADTWEKYYGLDPFDPADAGKDPDEDGLISKAEFQVGTIPTDPDTDQGGESDGSEVTGGRCPHRAADDLFAAPEPVTILADSVDESTVPIKPDCLLLQFPYQAGYELIRIYRTTDPAALADPSLVKDLVREIKVGEKPTTNYLDCGLADGMTYYYRLQAVGAAGTTSPFSGVVRATAKADPFSPEGGIIINGGAPRTDTPNLVIRLGASPDTKWFRLGEQRSLSGIGWKAMTSSTSYKISPAAAVEGNLVKIYHQFRDAYGNLSRVGSEPIRFLTKADSDGDGVADGADSDDDNDGLDDVDELGVLGTNPHARDSDRDGYGDGDEVGHGSDPLLRGILPWALHDRDSDGIPNPVEEAYGSDPDDPGDVPWFALRLVREGGSMKAAIPTIPGLHYEFEESPGLLDWAPAGGRRIQVRGDGRDFELPVEPAGGAGFYRCRIE